MKQDLLLKLISILVDSDESKPTKGPVKKDKWSHPLKGEAVIVRAKDAGCHFGYLEHFEGRVVTLSKSRRMYRWWSKTQMTLSAVAEFGLNEDKPLKIQNELPLIIIQDSCEIIPCTQGCVDSFGRVEPYNEQ
jgi:hypothetical protein